MKTMEGLETELYLAHERIKQLESKLFYSVPLSEVNEFCKNVLFNLRGKEMLSQEVLRQLNQAEKAKSLQMALDLYGVTREQYLDAKESMEMENELK